MFFIMPRVSESIEFDAYLPPIQSAIMQSGDGDLMQIKLNVNLGISPDAVKMMLMGGKRLHIKVKEIPERVTKANDAIKERPERASSKTRRRR